MEIFLRCTGNFRGALFKKFPKTLILASDTNSPNWIFFWISNDLDYLFTYIGLMSGKLSCNFFFIFSDSWWSSWPLLYTCVYKVAATDRGPAIGRRTAAAHPSANHLRQTGARINKVLPVRARQNLSSSSYGALRVLAENQAPKVQWLLRQVTWQNKPLVLIKIDLDTQSYQCYFFGFFI